MLSLKRWLVLGLAAAAVTQSPAVLRAAETGTIEGQIVLDGEVPALAPRVKKGDATARDAATCAADEVPNEKLVVDPATKGIANVFIYLKKAPANMPSELKASKTKEVVLDQKGCRYLPHALSVRTDQAVRCVSSDNVAHNVNVTPFVNEGKNFIVPGGDKVGTAVPLTKVEALPVKVNCDIHNWMTSFWVVTDHPYVAVTDAQGKFKIEGLPVGEHTFTVWQESAGYIDRKLVVNVKAGAQAVPVKKVPVASFKMLD